MSWRSISSSSIVSESLSNEIVGWAANRDSKTSVISIDEFQFYTLVRLMNKALFSGEHAGSMS